MNCKVETYFRVLLQSLLISDFPSEFVVACFEHEYPEDFWKSSQLTAGARRMAGLTVV